MVMVTTSKISLVPMAFMDHKWVLDFMDFFLDVKSACLSKLKPIYGKGVS